MLPMLAALYVSFANLPQVNFAHLDALCLRCVVGERMPCRSVGTKQQLRCLERSVIGGTDTCPPSTCDCMKLQCGERIHKHRMLCRDCHAGKFGVSVGGQVSCVFCPQGKFSTAQRGNCQCLSCPNNYFQPLFGKNVCQHCPGGYSSESVIASSFCQGSQQVTCFPGTYSAAHNTRCILCPQGKYNDKSSQKKCLKCPFGYIGSKHNSGSYQSCVISNSSCPKGKYPHRRSPHREILRKPNGRCCACPSGKFSPQKIPVLAIYNVFCLLCAKGQFTNGPGKSSCEFCTRGKFLSTEAASFCAGCTAGKFGLAANRTLGLPSRCVACPRGMYTVT